MEELRKVNERIQSELENQKAALKQSRKELEEEENALQQRVRLPWSLRSQLCLFNSALPSPYYTYYTYSRRRSFQQSVKHWRRK